MGKITAVICTCNRHSLLQNCLNSLYSQSLSTDDYKIIVIDNSTDQEVAHAFSRRTDFPANVNLYTEPVVGLSNARNRALELTKTPFIAFLDDDAIATENWLEQIYAAFHIAPEKIGVVGGKVLPNWEESPPQWLLGEVQKDDDGNYLNHSRPLLGNLSLVNWGGTEARELTEGEWLAGTNIAFKTSALERIGGFDTNLGRNANNISLLSNEEALASEKIVQLGYLRRYVPQAIVSHFIPKERISQAWILKRVAWQVISDMISKGKNFHHDSAESYAKINELIPANSQKEESLHSLFLNTQSADTFEKQIHALVSLIKIALVDPRPYDE